MTRKLSLSRRMRHPAVLIGCVAAGALLAAGCSSSSSSSATATSSAGASADAGTGSGVSAAAQQLLTKYTAEQTTIPQTVPLPKAPPKGETFVALVQESTSSDQGVLSGIEAGAKALGWNVTTISYDPTNPSSLQSAFASALLKHPVAVSVTGVPPSLWGGSTISQYEKAGVYIIPTAQQTGVASSAIPGYVATPEGLSEQYGAPVAWIAKDSGGSGDILISHVTGFPILDAEVTSVEQGVKKLCPSCSYSVADSTYSQFQNGQLDSGIVSELRQHPNIKYVYFDNGTFSAGINSALNAAGLSGVKITGYDMVTTSAEALRQGTQSAWMAGSEYCTGLGVIDLTARAVEHAGGAANDASVPGQLFTTANIGSTTVYQGPSNSLEQYEKLWKVSS
jgi:ABC-type sugar transport system substrate-binding protein